MCDGDGSAFDGRWDDIERLVFVALDAIEYSRLFSTKKMAGFDISITDFGICEYLFDVGQHGDGVAYLINGDARTRNLVCFE